MALLNRTRDFNITSEDSYVIGDADDGFVGTYAVHLVSASFSGVIKVKARSRLIGGIGVTSPAFVQIPYLPLYLNGSVGTYGTGSSVDITGTSILLIPASGLQITLDCTTFTSGAMACYVTPLLGASA